jgi:hypothetical protein
MRFVIEYRDPRQPRTAGVTLVGSESQAKTVVERLRREGFEVTSIISPPAGGNSGLV